MKEKAPLVKEEYPPDWVINLLRLIIYATSKILWQIEYRGTENIPQKLAGGLLITPNHQTYLDPFWIVVPVRRKLRFMAWDKACERPLIGRFIKFLGAFPVNIQKGDKEALVKSIHVLRDGATLMIFPEGSREFSDGKLLDFKTGAVRIAMKAEVPILPVTIRGANRVWSQEMEKPKFFRKIEIIFHPLIEIPPIPENMEEKDFAHEQTEKIKEIINRELTK